MEIAYNSSYWMLIVSLTPSVTIYHIFAVEMCVILTFKIG